MPYFQCGEYPEEGCVNCEHITDARFVIGCNDCEDPDCEGPIHTIHHEEE